MTFHQLCCKEPGIRSRRQSVSRRHWRCCQLWKYPGVDETLAGQLQLVAKQTENCVIFWVHTKRAVNDMCLKMHASRGKIVVIYSSECFVKYDVQGMALSILSNSIPKRKELPREEGQKVLGSFTTVYGNIDFYSCPPPLSRLGTGTGGGSALLCNG